MASWKLFHRQNQEMVNKFVGLALITSKEVENAFRCVNRAAFVSEDLLEEAFVDAPIKGSPFIHMSAPHLYASLLEDLELEPGMSFLNIGSGTGYFSCLAGYLIKKSGRNHGIEIQKDLVDFARTKVDEFISSGPPEAKEICPPVFISGNCFQLDPTQMKYDRLYCGGACPQSIITFFLQFLKIGGFLIAPVGTKLVKLERVSQKEGVRTVLSDVCFTSLTKLDSNEAAKLRHGQLPLLRFPIKNKNLKSKKTIFIQATFPVSKNPTKKKLARVRALQDALDQLENDGRLPLPFCYVAQIDQMNAYKQYNKSIQRRRPSTSVSIKTAASDNDTASPPLLTSSLVQPQTVTDHDSPRQLMTIQEFLLTVSPPAVFQEFYGHHNHSRINENRDTSFEQDFVGPRFGSLNEHTNIRRPSGTPINFPTFQRQPRTLSNLVNTQTEGLPRSTETPKSLARNNDNDFDIGHDVSKDIWEHLCSDKLWEMVVDYYYSLAASNNERRKQCFNLKGVEIINPTAAKLVDVLFYKLKSKKLIGEDTGEKSPNISCAKNKDNNDTIQSEVESVLNELVEKICHTDNSNDEKMDTSAESLDSILSLPSLCMDDMADSSFDNSFQNKNSSNTVNKTLKDKKTRFVDIKTDNENVELLSSVQNSTWSIEHDIELISFLVSEGKESEKHSLRDSAPKTIRPDMFDKMKLTKCPLISVFHPIKLAYRSVSLIRLAKVIDSVLDLLIGPSLKRYQFDNPFEKKYPLDSFSLKSFEGSDTQLNVVEAQSNVSNKKNHLEQEELTTSSVYLEAKTEKDEELLSEVKSMINYELSNVNQQQSILMRKLDLIDNIDEQFKEQIKLLTQQVELIDEQQRLLTEVHIETSISDSHGQIIRQPQQNVLDRKLQRQALIAKRDKITGDRNLQLSERRQLLSMLEQLLSLETRLRNEVKSLQRKGMGYLQGTESDLSNFSQFVHRAEQILGKLKTTSKKIANIGSDENCYEEKKLTHSTDNEDEKKISLRYQPQTILPRCRFLLPLSKKRFSFIREMLRTTERSPPEQLPIISIDRRVPLSERKQYGSSSTVFMQIYHGVKNKDLHYRWNKKTYEQWWEVKFAGEGIIDQGGGFRDSLTELSEELCPSSATMHSCLPLFIKTPNQTSGMGDHLDCYTLNPDCSDFHLYKWLGQLMGACFRTDERLPLALPPYIWKLLVGEHVSWKRDFVKIDETAVRNLDGLENLDEDAYNGLCMEQTYSTALSNGRQTDLIEHGSEIIVKSKERSHYSVLVRQTRMLENIKQVEALRNGLLLVVPNSVLSCLTWKNLEKGVCGDPLISIADLKANCRYADDLKVTSQCVIHMWAALTGFTNDERSRFIRFITGRKRLPSPFIVSRSSVDRDNLPSASTCGSNLFLPEYSSLHIAKEKIKYAIYNCVAIDTDTSPW